MCIFVAVMDILLLKLDPIWATYNGVTSRRDANFVSSRSLVCCRAENVSDTSSVVSGGKANSELSITCVWVGCVGSGCVGFFFLIPNTPLIDVSLFPGLSRPSLLYWLLWRITPLLVLGIPTPGLTPWIISGRISSGRLPVWTSWKFVTSSANTFCSSGAVFSN